MGEIEARGTRPCIVQISSALARQADAAGAVDGMRRLGFGSVTPCGTCFRACSGTVSASLVTVALASTLALLGAPDHEGDPSRRLTPIHTRLPPARIA